MHENDTTPKLETIRKSVLRDLPTGADGPAIAQDAKRQLLRRLLEAGLQCDPATVRFRLFTDDDGRRKAEAFADVLPLDDLARNRLTVAFRRGQDGGVLFRTTMDSMDPSLDSKAWAERLRLLEPDAAGPYAPGVPAVFPMAEEERRVLHFAYCRGFVNGKRTGSHGELMPSPYEEKKGVTKK